jgi:glycoside/pentoside/hexuronide:cation symporter, GPH family
VKKRHTARDRGVALSKVVRVSYGLGSICTAIFGTVPGLLLLYYMTDRLAIAPSLAGLVVFLPKVWDLVVNPLVGQLSDVMGSRRPWLLTGAAGLPIGFALVFAAPPLRGIGAAVFVSASLLFAATAYACFEVPFKAMFPELTDSEQEKSAILHWRMVFLGLALLFCGGVVPTIVNRGGYRSMGLIVAGVLFTTMLATYIGTSRAPSRRAAESGVKFRTQLTAVRGNSTYRRLLGFSCLQMLAIGTILTALPYFASYVLGSARLLGPLFLAITAPMLVTAPLWRWLSRYFDKRGAMIAASATVAVGIASLMFAGSLGRDFATGSAVVVGVGYSGVLLLQYSMMAEVIQADIADTGVRRAGAFTGVWTAMETLALAFGALIYSWILAAADFTASDAGHPIPQPRSAELAIEVAGTLLPAALMCLSALLAGGYVLRTRESANPHRATSLRYQQTDLACDDNM